jgi:transposase
LKAKPERSRLHGGYSRDSRPDALQLILAMVVTEEGLPLSYEVFEGNRADVTTLEEILDSVERKHGKLGRVWVFDRGIVSEENLALLRQAFGSLRAGT